MADNLSIIDDFIASWGAMDVERIMTFFAPDAVYTNMPIDPPNRGHAEIRATIGGFLGMASRVEFVVHHQAEDAARGIVRNERTDRFEMAPGRWAEIRVMGVFEMREGKILAWRDYFDLAEIQKAMGG